MGENRFDRRKFLLSMGSMALGLSARAMAQQQASDGVVEVRMERSERLVVSYMNPLGILIQPGQVVRWRNMHYGATVTAYHPANGNRELRIPEGAKPFDSGMMGGPTRIRKMRATFEWRFEQEGTYDYCSSEEELFGMVGRIIVGHPGGPGERPLGYGASEGRAPIFKKVIEVLSYAPSDKIVKEKIIPFPVKVFGRRY